MQPQAWSSWIPSRKYSWGWTTWKSTLHPSLHKTLRYLHGQSPLKGGTLTHIPVPTLWHNGQPTFVVNESSISRTIQSPGSWQILSSCVGWTSPAQLSTACSALQHSTAFKQEPHCPPVNHLAHPPHPNMMDWRQLTPSPPKTPFHSNCIFHLSCSHTLAARPCP